MRDKGLPYASEGSGYAKAARKREGSGNYEDARQLYLKAAKSFLHASKLSESGDTIKLRRGMAETFYSKAVSLKTDSRGSVKTRGGRGGGEGGDKEKEEIQPIEKPKLKFADVGGLSEVKEEIRKAIVYPIQHPELYEMYGKRAGEGILLYGPPGCGKTFIAKAAAGECDAPFLNLKISDILDKWLGESEKKVRNAFESAAKYAPSILFFDEIDAIGGRRSGEQSDHAKRLVNELLIQMDGVESRDKTLVLAATNEPWAVDPALRRPGRFSKLVLVPNPDNEARRGIFKLHLRNRPVEDLDFGGLAKLTNGYSSADIAQICSEAADIPLDEALQGKEPRKIAMNDFEKVLEKRKSSLTPWFRLALKEIERSGEEDIFEPLVKIIKREGYIIKDKI